MAGLMAMMQGGNRPMGQPAGWGPPAPAGLPGPLAPTSSPGLLSGNVSPMTMMGLSLLAGNRRSPTPTNPWASLAQGLQMSQQMQGQAQDREMRQKLLDLELQKASQPEKPETKVVNGALLERQSDGSWKEVVAPTTGTEPPKTRERYDGTSVIQEEWDPQTMKWNKIGEGQRWQPDYTRADAEYYTSFSTPQGMFRMNARTGEISPLTDANGSPIMKATDDPGLQGQIAAERKTGESTATREFNMSGLGSVIDEARGLLLQNPTQSGIGTAVDAAGRLVGVDVKGAKEAASLEAVGGALTSKMPRMEGPQGEKDAELYRQMAAQVGDSTIPVPQRIAALDMVEKLWRKWDSAERPNAKPADNMTMQTGAGWGIKKK